MKTDDPAIKCDCCDDCADLAYCDEQLRLECDDYRNEVYRNAMQAIGVPV